MGTIDIAGLVALLAERAAGGGRIIAGIAGAPGSGKSTVAERVVDALNAGRAGMAAILHEIRKASRSGAGSSKGGAA